MSWILILFLHINHLRYLFFAFFWDLREWGLSRRRNGKRNVVQEIIQGKGRGECHITETEKNDYFSWDSPPPQQYIHMQVRSCFQLAPIKETHGQKSSIFLQFFPQNFGRGRRWLTWLGVLYSPLSILLPLQICPSLTSGDAESRSNLSRLHIVPIIFIKYPISADYWGKHSWKKFWLHSKPILPIVFFKFVLK